MACGTPAPRPRQAGSTPGHHAFSFMGPGLAPSGLSEGQLGGPPVSQAAPRTGWSEQQAASLNVGTPWLLPTAYGRPPLALLPRRWVPGSADGATHAHTRWQRREWRRKAALAPAQAVSPAQTPPPRQHRHPLQLLVLLQLGLHLAQPILHAAMTLSRLSAKNSISSALNDPVLTARGL